MSAADKLSLEQRLAKVLSISIDDDGEYVTDVLDSLIDIGDPEDIAEYLSSFVAGGDDDDVGEDCQLFAQDVMKLKRGERISSAGNAKPAAEVMEVTKPKAKIWDEAAAHREEIKRREAEAREKQQEERERLAQQKAEEDKQRRREAAVAAQRKQLLESNERKKAIASQQKQKAELQKAASEKAKSNARQNQSKSSGAASAKRKEPKIQKAKQQQNRPGKGTPKNKRCGCFGNKHNPLTNCLRCGRISCELEGINDYCHCCGYFIEEVSMDIIDTGDEKQNSALKHKERLLKFDRESVKRTHIHDDQEDYFVASNSMWATQEEQEEAGELEAARRKKLHERQNQTLKISF